MSHAPSLSTASTSSISLDAGGLTRQLAQAKRIISAQQDELDALRQQLREQQRRLDERSAELIHSQRVIQARINQLQDECERVSAVLTGSDPSSSLSSSSGAAASSSFSRSASAFQRGSPRP